MCILIQMWAWEHCTTLAPKRTPLVIENKPLGHRWLRRGNQHIDNDDLIVFRRKLDIMKRHEFLWESYTTTVMSVLPPIWQARRWDRPCGTSSRHHAHHNE
ncbi:hypothetical protein GmHk_18G052801 [Glycine max]|nr:hypothetical protein GmHk_18G052801 [Glycine max]